MPTPFPVGPVNVHVIRRDPVTLIDAGPLTAAAWEALGRGLARLGLAPRDVKRVLLTHGHHDHFGLAARLADAGASVHGGAADATRFAMSRDVARTLDRLTRAGLSTLERAAVVAAAAWTDRHAAPLERWGPLHGGETLAGDGYALRALAAPGHTPGSLVFELPERRILFTGDSVLARITPNAVVVEDPERPGADFRSLTLYVATLAGLARGHAGWLLLTGHGENVRDLRAHAARGAAFTARRASKIEESLAAGPASVRELVSVLFPGVSRLQLFLAYSEVAGFLMYLEDRGRVTAERSGRLERWRLRGDQAPARPARWWPSGPAPAPSPGASASALRT